MCLCHVVLAFKYDGTPDEAEFWNANQRANKRLAFIKRNHYSQLA